MNFLQLTQRLAQEAAVAGIVPTAVTGQTNEPQRLVDWINDALREITELQKFDFLWEQVDITIPNGLNYVATGLQADRWDLEASWLQVPGQQERWLEYVRWETWSYNNRILAGDGNISQWTIRPDKAFVVNAKAVGDTAINVQRWKIHPALVANTDVPLLPDDLHMYIVYTALKKYAGYDEAGNQRTIAVDEMKTLREALYRRCLPAFTLNLAENILLD
jgi:hypothetical protein